MQQHLPLAISELLPGGFKFETTGLAHGKKQREVVAVLLIAPGGYGRIDGQGGVGHDPFHGEAVQVADAVAIGTGAVGTVERKQPRRQFLNHGAVDRAGKIFGIEAFPLLALRQGFPLPGHHFHQGQSLTALQGGPQGIGEPLGDALARHQAVNNHLDVVGVVFI